MSVKRIKSKAKALRSLIGYRKDNDYELDKDLKEVKNHINNEDGEQ